MRQPDSGIRRAPGRPVRRSRAGRRTQRRRRRAETSRRRRVRNCRARLRIRNSAWVAKPLGSTSAWSLTPSASPGQPLLVAPVRQDDSALILGAPAVSGKKTATVPEAASLTYTRWLPGSTRDTGRSAELALAEALDQRAARGESGDRALRHAAGGVGVGDEDLVPFARVDGHRARGFWLEFFDQRVAGFVFALADHRRLAFWPDRVDVGADVADVHVRVGVQRETGRPSREEGFFAEASDVGLRAVEDIRDAFGVPVTASASFCSRRRR